MRRRHHNNMDDLFISLSMGSSEWLRHYLQNGGVANLKNVQGTTLLHKAVEENSIDKVKLLIQHGCEVNAFDNEDCSPIYLSIDGGYTSILSVLLEANADVNLVKYQHTTPLIYAVVEENLEAVKLILEKGHNCDVNLENYAQQTALTQAIVTKNLKICELLLQKGASVKGIYNRNVITQKAARHMSSDIQMMKLFLDYSSELDLHYHLLVSCLYRNLDVAELLLFRFDDPFQLKALGFILKVEEDIVWQKLIRSVVKRYRLATDCSSNNKLLTMLLSFCDDKLLPDTDRRNITSRALSLIRTLVKYGLVIHPQSSVRSCKSSCDCRRCIFTALHPLDSVTSLQGQCCSRIRQSLVMDHDLYFDLKLVNSLPLPQSLKDFISMQTW